MVGHGACFKKGIKMCIRYFEYVWLDKKSCDFVQSVQTSSYLYEHNFKHVRDLATMIILFHSINIQISSSLPITRSNFNLVSIRWLQMRFVGVNTLHTESLSSEKPNGKFFFLIDSISTTKTIFWWPYHFWNAPWKDVSIQLPQLIVDGKGGGWRNSGVGEGDIRWGVVNYPTLLFP